MKKGWTREQRAAFNATMASKRLAESKRSQPVSDHLEETIKMVKARIEGLVALVDILEGFKR